MIVIRNEQMAMLSRHLQARFEQHLAAHLSEAAGSSLLEAQQRLAAVLALSRDFGLVNEADIARFGVMLVKAAPHHSVPVLPPAVRSILLSYGQTATRRLDELERWLLINSLPEEIHDRKLRPKPSRPTRTNLPSSVRDGSPEVLD